MFCSSQGLSPQSLLWCLLIWISIMLTYGQDDVTTLWANEVLNFSTEFDTANGAAQALGPNDVYPAYGDFEYTWTQARHSRNKDQFIEVGFSEALNLTQIDIYETFSAGAVRKILARTPTTQPQWYTLYYNDTVTKLLSSRIYQPPISIPPCKIDALRIEVDCTFGGNPNWVEIDAIQIHGYRGCIQGKWGMCCTDNCGHCWDGNICDDGNGFCPKIGNFTCDPAYKGDRCDEVCANGTFGNDCLKFCGNCAGRSDQCNVATGRCPDNTPRCAQGFHGLDCKQSCSSNKYGADCAEQCGHCAGGSGTCSPITGECPGSPACLPGYKGAVCKTLCTLGSFGTRCNETCGDCEGGVSNCNHVTGLCSSGCTPGHHGDLCKQECTNGTWGSDCLNNCSGNCKIWLAGCDITDGSCADGCIDGYQGSKCSTKSSLLPPDTGGSGAVIGGVVGAAVLVLLVVVIVIFFVKRQRKTKNEQEEIPNEFTAVVSEDRYAVPPSTVPDDHTSALPSSGQRRRDGEYYNVVPFRKGPSSVPVDEIEAYVRTKRADDKLNAEYESLPKGLHANCEVAKKSENKGKDRYQNIVAYDHSRVVLDPLDDDPDSDYINACYIHGYEEDNKYVASQGPTGVIVNDFWRAIWQVNTGKVVMLTNLMEDGKNKSELYWPVAVSDTSEFGLISVSLFDEEVFADFTVRILHVTNKKHPGQTKEIKQFHFTVWPDHGVPTQATGLLNFRDKVNNAKSKLNGPLFIHCSAGIGRTGTFIGLDYLIKQANKDGVVDVPACVRLMRQQRTNMIQTVGQYEFLYDALIEAIKLSNCSIPSVDFSSVHCDLCVANPNTGQTKLQKQFKALMDLSPALKTTDMKSSTDPVNLQKSRNPTILAADNVRPFLSTPVSDCNDYINAVFLPAYKRKRAFIITQMPLPGTVVDFWRLIHEQDVRTVIMLNTVYTTRNDVGTYWPKTSAQYGPFAVETVEVEGGDSFVTRSLRFQYKEEAQRDKANIKQFQCTFWQEDTKVPGSTGPLITLIDEVERWQEQSGNGPIIVHCLDGATKSGLYCAVSSIIERLKVDQEVNILQTIKQMRINRPEIVDNLEQFRFTHDVVLTYLESFQTYANFQ